MTEPLIYRLRKRAEIRRQISTRKSVQEGQPDRLAALLEEAADEIEALQRANNVFADLLVDKEHKVRMLDIELENERVANLFR